MLSFETTEPMRRTRLPHTLPTVLLVLSITASASTARAGDFVDLRLSFNLTDENVLVSPGQTNPSIPGPRIGAPFPTWGTFFFDNYDTRYTGFENLTNLVLYKKLTVNGDDFEGAFVLAFNTISDNLSAIYDNGSYLAWKHWLDPSRVSKANVSITAFPLSSDRMRLGYSYKISWGGSPIFFKPNPDNPYASTASTTNTNPVPGAKVQFATENSYVYLGAKTTVLLNTAINEQQSVYAILGGAGVDVTKMLRIEANGGYFDRGVNPIQQVLGQPVQTYGVSGQITLHDGVPVGKSADYVLYRNDPSAAIRFFEPEEYPGGVSWLVSSEVTWTQSTLQNPDLAGSTTRQNGFAADINFRMKVNHWRLHADLNYQDLEFVLLDVPSFVPFQAISETTAKTSPEIFGAIGADYYFAGPHITFGGTVGVEHPATFTGQLPQQLIGNVPPEGLPTSTTVVVRTEGLFDILPAGLGAAPIYDAKIWGKWQAGAFDVLAEMLVGHDENQTQLQRTGSDPNEPLQRVTTNPWQLGFNIALQARL
jgi:hypothetical protein